MSIARITEVQKKGTDPMTYASVTIDSANKKTHDGKHFKTGYQDTPMAENDTITMLFVTPNTTEWAHWTLTAQTTGAAKVEIFEGTVASANGTATTILNRNRNSSIVSSTLAFHTPTVTTDGTKLSSRWIGSEGWRSEIGGGFTASHHFLLKQNAKYLVRMTAISDGIVGAIGGDWYEHTNP